MLDPRPFTGHVVRADRAARVVAPPYDALDPAARAALSATDPDSYLGALPPGGAPVDRTQLDAVLERCRHHLDDLLARGRYLPVDGPAVGVLALDAGDDRAVATVVDVPVAAFEDGRVLPHERVQDRRVDELTRYLEVVGVASSPVAVTQAPDDEVAAATGSVVEGPPPAVAYRASDGVDVALWLVTDPQIRDRLLAAVAAAGPAYVADGHHRAAAARRYAAAVGAGPDEPAGRVLCAVVPSDQLTVLPFHRRVDGVDPGEVSRVLDELDELDEVTVTPLAGPTAPASPHRVTVTVGGDWSELDLTPWVRDDDVVERLDVRLVERDLLSRLAPGRTAVPVAPTLGLAALAGADALGVALHPPTIDDVLAVAAADRDLPAKTTYVTPKLRSGLLVTPRPRPRGADHAREPRTTSS